MDPRLKFPSVIITGPHDGPSSTFDWLQSQLKSVVPAENNPDILVLNSEATYKLADFEDVFRTIPIRPLKEPLRRIIIRRAELVPDLIYNKLLKALEETKFNQYLMLTSTRSAILPTIVSRSVIIRRPPRSTESAADAPKLLNLSKGELIKVLAGEGDEAFLVSLQSSLPKETFGDDILAIEKTLQANNPNWKVATRYHLTSILQKLA